MSNSGRVRLTNVPTQKYAFGYRVSPRSGNEINGLSDPKRQQAQHVFHSAGDVLLDWQALDDFFGLISSWRVLRHVIINAWQLRNCDGPVATTKRPVEDRRVMAAKIKEMARGFGAELAGISQVTNDVVYEGRSISLRYAVCLGLSMDRKETQHVPHVRAAVEVMRAYREASQIAIRLAGNIRKMGWPARAYGNPNSTDILHIPLGQQLLRKSGSTARSAPGTHFDANCAAVGLGKIWDAFVEVDVPFLDPSNQLLILKYGIWRAINHTSSAL